jgi:hypothetical protein
MPELEYFIGDNHVYLEQHHTVTSWFSDKQSPSHASSLSRVVPDVMNRLLEPKVTVNVHLFTQSKNKTTWFEYVTYIVYRSVFASFEVLGYLGRGGRKGCSKEKGQENTLFFHISLPLFIYVHFPSWNSGSLGPLLLHIPALSRTTFCGFAFERGNKGCTWKLAQILSQSGLY